MRIDRKALKSSARLALHRQPGHSPRRVTVLYLLLSGALSPALGLTGEGPVNQLIQMLRQGIMPGRALALAVTSVGTMGLFINILLMIVRLVADIGYASWALQVSRGEKTGAAALLDGFGMVGRVLLLNAAVAVLSLCWYAVIFMPLIALAVLLPVGGGLIPVLIVAGLVLFGLCVLRYAMAEFCLLDEPDKGVFFALRTSRRLMRGRTVEYGVLLLSFLGWVLLGTVASWVAESAAVVVLGGLSAVLNGDAQQILRLSTHPVVVGVATLAGWLVSLWVQPYFTVTQAGYYDHLRRQRV